MDRIEDLMLAMTVSDDEKTKVMFAAAKAEDLYSVKILIAAGADPLAECSKGSNLLITLYLALNSTSSKDKVLQIIDYVLNLPQYQELTQKSEKVYRNVLLNLSKEFYKKFEDISQILKLIFEFKDINQLVFVHEIYIPYFGHRSISYNPGSLFVYKFLKTSESFTEELEITDGVKILCSLTEIGFSTQDAPGCVNVLAILLSHCLVYPDKLTELIKYALKYEINIESCTSTFCVLSEGASDKNLEWLVPDVLVLSLFYQEGENLVKKFLPHWWGPPLALIFLTFHSLYTLKNKHFSQLMWYGGIPHGTNMFKCVDDHIRELLKMAQTSDTATYGTDAQDFLHIFDSYKQLVASPMRLTDLAKYAVRQSLAVRAAQPDTNLPMLLKQNLPPLLYEVCTEYLQ